MYRIGIKTCHEFATNLYLITHKMPAKFMVWIKVQWILGIREKRKEKQTKKP